jgi:hypothetical protein
MMSITNQPIETIQTIRETVNRNMVDLGAKREDLVSLDESVIHDGPHEVAMRFRAGQMIALWNFSHERLQFFDSHGSRLRTLRAE